MKTRFLSFLILLFCLPGWPGLAASSGASDVVFDDQRPERPKLHWETLRGYRLFFHPADTDAFRRSLVVDVPTEAKVRSAWALVKPVLKNPKWDDDAWLRVEGVAEPGRMRITWDGLYRDQEFGDKLYLFEVHLRRDRGEPWDWQVVVVKSKDHPRFTKVGSEELKPVALAFDRGDFLPVGPSAVFSKASAKELPVTAKVLLPDLPQPFTLEGVQMAARFIQDTEGKKPFNGQSWDCVCQQSIPADSPARKEAKSVRCKWDISSLAPGLYELKLSLWHKLNHPAQKDSCDVPELDEDRVRVVIQP